MNGCQLLTVYALLVSLFQWEKINLFYVKSDCSLGEQRNRHCHRMGSGIITTQMPIFHVYKCLWTHAQLKVKAVVCAHTEYDELKNPHEISVRTCNMRSPVMGLERPSRFWNLITGLNVFLCCKISKKPCTFIYI